MESKMAQSTDSMNKESLTETDLALLQGVRNGTLKVLQQGTVNKIPASIWSSYRDLEVSC